MLGIERNVLVDKAVLFISGIIFLFTLLENVVCKQCEVPPATVGANVTYLNCDHGCCGNNSTSTPCCDEKFGITNIIVIVVFSLIAIGGLSIVIFCIIRSKKRGGRSGPWRRRNSQGSAYDGDDGGGDCDGGGGDCDGGGGDCGGDGGGGD